MTQYEPKKFISALDKKAPSSQLVCPYCHGNKFTSTENYATIIIGKDLSSITLGASIPSGIAICQNCGHIDFFALGVLGLLGKREETNGK